LKESLKDSQADTIYWYGGKEMKCIVRQQSVRALRHISNGLIKLNIPHVRRQVVVVEGLKYAADKGLVTVKMEPISSS